MKLISLESLQDLLKKKTKFLALVAMKEGDEISLASLISDKVSTLDAVDGWEKIADALASFNLFEEEKIVVVSNGEKLKAADLSKLSYPENRTLIFTAIAAPSHPLYKWVQDQGVIVDLSKENKFDKEKRYLSLIQKEALACGKKIGSEAAKLLLQQVGTDSMQLSSEIQKLACFVGKEDAIKIEHIVQVTPNTHEDTIWQLMDALLKKDGHAAMQIGKNLMQESSFYSLIRQIRTQMQTEYQIADLLMRPNAEEEIQKRFPYMKGKILQLHMDQAGNYGAERFKAALITIDTIDLHSKNGVDDLDLLIELLITKLTLSKK